MLTIDEHNNVIPEPSTLMIKEFGDIWKKDKSKNKETALKYFAFIYFKYDLKSKYRNSYSGTDLDKMIKIDLFKDSKFKLSSEVHKAGIIFNNLQITKSLKLLLSAEGVLEQITNYFDNFDINEVEDVKDKADIILKVMRNLKEIDEVTSKIEVAKKRIEADLYANTQSTKRKLSNWELPK